MRDGDGASTNSLATKVTTMSPSIKSAVEDKKNKKYDLKHDPMDFVNQYISHTRNTGNLLSLSISIIGFSAFFGNRDIDIGVDFMVLAGVFIFLYNVLYTLKSIDDYKYYLNYFENTLDDYHPIYRLYYPRWKNWIYYQYTFVALVSSICILFVVVMYQRTFSPSKLFSDRSKSR